MISLKVSAILPPIPVWSLGSRTEKSPSRTDCKARSSFFRSMSISGFAPLRLPPFLRPSAREARLRTRSCVSIEEDSANFSYDVEGLRRGLGPKISNGCGDAIEHVLPETRYFSLPWAPDQACPRLVIFSSCERNSSASAIVPPQRPNGEKDPGSEPHCPRAPARRRRPGPGTAGKPASDRWQAAARPAQSGALDPHQHGAVRPARPADWRRRQADGARRAVHRSRGGGSGEPGG